MKRIIPVDLRKWAPTQMFLCGSLSPSSFSKYTLLSAGCQGQEKRKFSDASAKQ
jgi:hypothetical protein